jgi:hypothetical protein
MPGTWKNTGLWCMWLEHWVFGLMVLKMENGWNTGSQVSQLQQLTG